MLNPGHIAGEARCRLVKEFDGDQTTCLTTEDPAQLGAPSAPKRYALPTQWEQHKEKIRQLYLDENKPLAQVMQIMSRDYGHEGSIKQYKYRLAQWGFDTKYKKHQSSQKRKVQLRKRQSATAAADHLLAAPAADHYPQTTEAGRANILNAISQGSENREKSLQLAVPRRRPLTQPHADGVRSARLAVPPLSSTEQIFLLTQQHVETSFSYGLWKVDNSNVCMSVKCTKEDMDLPEAHFDLLRSAVLLFAQKLTTEAKHVLSKAFALVEAILKSGHARALNFFWTALVYLIQFGHEDIVVLLIGHIKNMAKVVLHPSHPIGRLFTLLAQVDVFELESLVHRTWQLTIDAFQKQLPSLHPECVRHECDLIFRMYGTRDTAAGGQRLLQLLEDCKKTVDTPELSHLTVLNALGYNFLNSKNWAEAANIGHTLEERAQLSEDTELLVYQLGGLEIQARAFNELKLVRPAVALLARATPVIAKEWGNEDPWRIELMALQQNWLRESGDFEAADALKAEIASLAEKLVSD